MTRLLGIIGTVAATAVAAAAGPASAGASDIAASHVPPTSFDYWTAERMQDAIHNSSPSTLADAAREPTPAPAQLPGLRAVGRVFSVRPNGENYACSGTLVDSANRSLVWTAGHCLHRGSPAGFHTNVMFVPAYQPQSTGNVAPFGIWNAREMGVPNAWARRGAADSRQAYRPDVDGGVIVLARDAAGRTLTDVLGVSQHIAFPRRIRDKVRMIGYPLAAPYNGEAMMQCGPQRTQPRRGLKTVFGIRCPLGSGMSGGPALTDMDPASGIGTVVGPNSANDGVRRAYATVNRRLFKQLYRRFAARAN